MVGTEIGHYRIEARLGAGAMGEVYRAFDTRLERPVAIKVFPDLEVTPKARRRLLHEARSASALNHTNVCTIYEVNESGDTMYLVMEFVEGQTLDALIPSGGLPVGTVVSYGTQIAGALSHAHARGIVHRDLKCANVVVASGGHVKVLDFGLALRQIETSDDATRSLSVQDSMLAPGSVAGTLAYMSPEALRAETVDRRTDIWALGVMLYEMASGKRPFRGYTTYELSGQILHDPPAPLPEHVPAALRAVVSRCLAKDPNARFPDAHEVRAGLETIHTSSGAAVSVPAGTSERRALLVLPFANLVADPESDYFADGLTEEIITDLSTVTQLRVISRTSSLQFKGTTLTMAELAQRLRVGHVLEGSVRRIGGNLRITAKLIEVASDSPIWGSKYSGTLDDIFAIQEQLSRAIVAALKVALTPHEERQLGQHPIADVRAYEWYLRAKQELLRFTKDSLDRAVECLERAEAIDAENALILAAKGEAYWQYINTGASADPAYLDRADACVRRVLEIDPKSPQGLRVAGLVRVHRGDTQGALQRLRQALELAPNDPDCLLWGCLLAAFSGRLTLGETWAARLVEIDPVTPFFQLMPGSVAWLSGDYERAWALWTKRHTDILENPLMRLVYGHVAIVTGRVDEGNRILDELAHALPDNSFGQLAFVYRQALEGNRAEALAALTPSLVGALESDLQYCWFLGQCYALAGDVDAGIRWVETAVAHGFINHDLLARRDPFLANLRGDPRYDSLMQDVQRRMAAVDA